MHRTLFAVSLASLLAYGQQPPAPLTIRGEVDDGRAIAGRYMVKMYSLANHLETETAFTGSNGEFELRNTPAGSYELSVLDNSGAILTQTMVNVTDAAGRLEVRLPRSQNESFTSGPVSLARLRHKVPKSANKEFKAARRAQRAGDNAEAVKRLNRAIADDPAFADAHNDLGALYVGMKRYGDALRELDAALALDAADLEAHVNRALCLARMERYPEAETEARRAIQLNPPDDHARYLLGAILLSEKNYSAEAVDNLERSAMSFPAARLLAAQALAHEGSLAAAQEQLKLYLATGNPEKREQASAWLTRLRSTQ